MRDREEQAWLREASMLGDCICRVRQLAGAPFERAYLHGFQARQRLMRRWKGARGIHSGLDPLNAWHVWPRIARFRTSRHGGGVVARGYALTGQGPRTRVAHTKEARISPGPWTRAKSGSVYWYVPVNVAPA